MHTIIFIAIKKYCGCEGVTLGLVLMCLYNSVGAVVGGRKGGGGGEWITGVDLVPKAPITQPIHYIPADLCINNKASTIWWRNAALFVYNVTASCVLQVKTLVFTLWKNCFLEGEINYISLSLKLAKIWN